MEGIQSKKNQIVGILIMLVIMGATTYFIFRKESLSNVIDCILSVDPVFIIIAISMMVLYIVFEGVNTWIVLRAIGQDTTLLNAIGYGFVGFYFSSITPSASGGQPAQVFFMKKDGIPITKSSLALLVVLFAHQLVIMIYGIFGIFIMPSFNHEHIQSSTILLAYGFLTNGIILLGIFVLIVRPRYVSLIVNFLGGMVYRLKIIKNKEKLTNRIEKSIKNYRDGAVYIRENPKVILVVIILTFIQVFIMFAIPFVIYTGFMLKGNSLGDMLFTQTVLNIEVSSLPLPGAVGATESVFLDMFRHFFKDLVVPGMLLTRIANFYSVLVISGIVSLIMYIKDNKKDEISSENLEVESEFYQDVFKRENVVEQDR